MDTSCQCCIVGAGPAGMLLGLLLARKGVSVKLLEMHPDLGRDFRGDTVHASTLEILDQIGLADEVLKLSHNKMRRVAVHTPKGSLDTVSFERLKTRFPYVAVMPQEDFLHFLSRHAEQYDSFEMLLGTAVTGLIEEHGVIKGVTAKQQGIDIKIGSQLVVAADGRFSKLRKLAGFTAESLSPPMDVAWLRMPRESNDEEDAGAFYIAHGRICVLLTRPKEWQLGYVFPKGDFNEIRKQGIESFRNDIASIVPWLGNRVDIIEDFSNVHLLTVKSDRLEKWYRDGLLFIGDAAHAMSPVGGVGINYAISDAVEAANVLTGPLLANEMSEKHLAEVQQRRIKPTRSIQRLQALMQKNIVSRALRDQEFELPLIARIILKIPFLRDIPGRTMALGITRVRLE